MPVNVVRSKKDEEIWNAAKTAARKKFTGKTDRSKRFWKYTMGTFQAIKKNSEK